MKVAGSPIELCGLHLLEIKVAEQGVRDLGGCGGD